MSPLRAAFETDGCGFWLAMALAVVGTITLVVVGIVALT